MKLSVVPEESDRWTGEIAVDGSVTSGFCWAIAGSFQVLIEPAKILATVVASRFSLSTPCRLKAMSIGEMKTGTSTGSLPLHACFAFYMSVSAIAESEPANF